MNCTEARFRIETGAAGTGAEAHLRACRKCREFAALRAWSEQVLRAGEIAAPAPPPMAAVWAAIRRNSENAWDGALARSFRRLVPYLASITVLFLLAGSLALRKPTPVQAEVTPTAQSLLAPTTAVASNTVPDQTPADPLGIGAP